MSTSPVQCTFLNQQEGVDSSFVESTKHDARDLRLCKKPIFLLSPFFPGLISNSATRKLSRFGNYLVDRTYDGLTTFVYNGINRFKRRNYYSNRHNQRPVYTNRKTDYAYDYYDETDYFRY